MSIGGSGDKRASGFQSDDVHSSIDRNAARLQRIIVFYLPAGVLHIYGTTLLLFHHACFSS